MTLICDSLHSERHALTQMDLDRMQCADPNCRNDHSVMTMEAGCHPKAGLVVAYNKATGILHIGCAHCERVISLIAVAALPGGNA